VTGIRLPVFLGATAIGLAPTIFLWTYFADALAHLGDHDKGQLLGRFVMMIGVLLLVASRRSAIRRIRRWRRYRRCSCARRSARSPGDERGRALSRAKETAGDGSADFAVRWADGMAHPRRSGQVAWNPATTPCATRPEASLRR